jgi:CDP-6-deoxy-D-xylo-4-hexulose-3-dehydrase
VHGEEEIAAVVEVLRTSTQMGARVREMQRQVAELFGKPFGVMVNSGSSALELAVRVAGLQPGEEFVTPVLTFATTLAPALRAGWRPIFVDVEPDTDNNDVDRIEEKITPRTRAMVIPNLIGNLPDWDRIRSIADRHGLIVI